jgi:tRNA pseudouridine55 synthase
VKHRGKPLYYWTRRGVAVRPVPRKVLIYSLDLLKMNPEGNPHLLCRVECSKGTYIRTLAEEIGRLIGCGAHLYSLRRLFVGPFAVEQAHTLEALKNETRPARIVIPMDRALQHLPFMNVTAQAVRALQQGKPVPVERCELAAGEMRATDRPFRIYDPEGKFQALARLHHAGNALLLKTEKFLA